MFSIRPMLFAPLFLIAAACGSTGSDVRSDVDPDVAAPADDDGHDAYARALDRAGIKHADTTSFSLATLEGLSRLARASGSNRVTFHTRVLATLADVDAYLVDHPEMAGAREALVGRELLVAFVSTRNSNALGVSTQAFVSSSVTVAGNPSPPAKPLSADSSSFASEAWAAGSSPSAELEAALAAAGIRASHFTSFGVEELGRMVAIARAGGATCVAFRVSVLTDAAAVSRYVASHPGLAGSAPELLMRALVTATVRGHSGEMVTPRVMRESSASFAGDPSPPA